MRRWICYSKPRWEMVAAWSSAALWKWREMTELTHTNAFGSRMKDLLNTWVGVIRENEDSRTMLRILKDLFIFILSMWMYPCMCAHDTCVPGTQGGQKMAPDPLELESQVVLGHHVGSGNHRKWEPSLRFLMVSFYIEWLNGRKWGRCLRWGDWLESGFSKQIGSSLHG